MSDQLVDTVVTVAADGTTGADFTGHVHARGLDLDAGTVATAPSDDRVRWLRTSDGALVADVYAYNIAGTLSETRLESSDPDGLQSDVKLSALRGGVISQRRADLLVVQDTTDAAYVRAGVTTHAGVNVAKDFLRIVTNGDWNSDLMAAPLTIVPLGAGAGANVALTINTAFLVQMLAPAPFTVTSVCVHVGVTGGNFDLGIYDAGFNRLWSRGSIAVPAAGSAVVSIAAGSPATLRLAPGPFFAVIDHDNAAATFAGVTTFAAAGAGLFKSVAQALPLPATLAPANIGDNVAVPWLALI